MRNRLIVLSLFVVLFGAYGYFHFTAMRKSPRTAPSVTPEAGTPTTSPHPVTAEVGSRKPQPSAQDKNDIVSKALVLPPAPTPQPVDPLRP